MAGGVPTLLARNVERISCDDSIAERESFRGRQIYGLPLLRETEGRPSIQQGADQQGDQ
jgi:hypothetical protein